jgi:hypothetical protein
MRLLKRRQVIAFGSDARNATRKLSITASALPPNRTRNEGEENMNSKTRASIRIIKDELFDIRNRLQKLEVITGVEEVGFAMIGVEDAAFTLNEVLKPKRAK